MTKDPLHYAKGIVAVIGAGVTAALGLIPEGSTAWVCLTIAAAMLTVLAVVIVPNKPAP